MDTKSLTESGWRAEAAKFKVKDNGLDKALAAYEKLADDDYDERLKCIISVSQLAAALKKAKEIAALPEVIKYLGGVLAAAEGEKGEIGKAKAQAEKAEIEAKKREAHQKDEDENDADEDEEEGDYAKKLLAVFQKLKGAKGLSYEFIICDAKPHCGLMVAKKITMKHRTELTNLTDGSKRFLPPGTCHFEEGKFNFTMEKPVAGLARKLQDSIKNFTGKKLPIKLGLESAEGDEQEHSAAAAPGVGVKPEAPGLAKAPDAWHQTRSEIEATIRQLKDAVRKAFADQAPELIGDIEKNMTKLDAILDKLDRRLADSLARAHAAKDAAARAAELRNSKVLLADYIKYVKSEPLIGHIDANPFGVKTDLRHKLGTKLTEMAQAIG